jgi:hypothetical protein
MPEEPESRRPDIPELIRRAERSAAKADAARERLVTAHRAGAASQERLARHADQDGRSAIAAEHREAAAREQAAANQLSSVPQTPRADRRRDKGDPEAEQVSAHPLQREQDEEQQ